MNKTSVRERLLNAAEKLFYSQGYRATGINQIIKEAGAAKASFYQHFPSKEDFCTAYLMERHTVSHQRQKEFISRGSTPAEKIASLFDNIRSNTAVNNFNGCPFLNIASEINEHESEIRKAVTLHKTRLMDLIRNELEGFKNADALTEMVYLIYEGANISVKNYRSLWPVDRGAELAFKLISEAQNEQ